MTDSGWIEGEALEELLPHRGLNMLLDAVRTSGSGDPPAEGQAPSGARPALTGVGAEGRLVIAPDDARGRDIFLRDCADGGQAVLGAALAEHLALDAICVLAPEMAPGEIAFFSVISKFELAREVAAGEAITSEVRRLRDKGRFRRFEGVVRGAGGEAAASAEIMAYAAEAGSTSDRRESAKIVAPPQVRETRPVDRALFRWKRPEMVFIDERVDVSADLDRATFRYTYPADHPFCAGHFPGNPVMMGIAQWIAAADAAAWLVLERAEAGIAPFDRQAQGAPRELERAPPADDRWRADVDILREKGNLIAEVRGLAFTASASSTDGLTPVRVENTRRVGFRDQVRPGETVFVRVRLAGAE